MDYDIKGKGALILASTSGLGFACAEALIAEGVRVVINGRSRTTGEQAKLALGSMSHFIAADVADHEQRNALIGEAKAHLGAISILVVNGNGPTADSFMQTTLPQWDEAFRQMVVAAVDVIRQCVPNMVESNWGRIISLGSISGKEISLRGSRPNSMRPALIGAIGTLARELAADGVTANTILSGPFDTPAMRKVVREHSGRMDLSIDDAVSVYAESGPMKRVGRPEELGALCAFLASEQAGYITGQAIAIDGGRVATLY